MVLQLALVVSVAAYVVPVVLFVPCLLICAAGQSIVRGIARGDTRPLLRAALATGVLAWIVFIAAEVTPAEAPAVAFAGTHLAAAFVARRWWTVYIGLGWLSLPYAWAPLTAIALVAGFAGLALCRIGRRLPEPEAKQAPALATA
jgi:hypothetical protein